METVNYNKKTYKGVYLSCCLVFLSTTTSHRRKKNNLPCQNFNYPNFLFQVTFSSPDLNCLLMLNISQVPKKHIWRSTSFEEIATLHTATS